MENKNHENTKSKLRSLIYSPHHHITAQSHPYTFQYQDQLTIPYANYPIMNPGYYPSTPNAPPSQATPGSNGQQPPLPHMSQQQQQQQQQHQQQLLQSNQSGQVPPDMPYYYNYPIKLEPGLPIPQQQMSTIRPQQPHQQPGPPHMIPLHLQQFDQQQQNQHQQQPQLQPQQHHSPQQIMAPQTESRKRPASSNSNTRVAATYPRKRALTACDACRLKKVKCDNVRPICGSCVKIGITSCHYRTDDLRKDYSSYDPASLNILSKLDVILRDLNDLKRNNGVEPARDRPSISTSLSSEPQTTPSITPSSVDSLQWDMSLTSVFNWHAFKNLLRTNQFEIDKSTHQLLNDYKRTEPSVLTKLSFKNKMLMFDGIEKLLGDSLPILINSFFLNSHTKIPVLDTIEIMESIESYKIMQAYDDKFTFCRLLQLYDSAEQVVGGGASDADQIKVPQEFLQALDAANIADEPYRRRAFVSLFRTVPQIILMCAIGALATPVHLGNMETFESSLAERDCLTIGCLGNIVPPGNVPKSRFQIAHLLSEYSKLLTLLYPFTLKVGSLQMVEYGLLRSQYELYIMSPLIAYRSMSEACHHMMYYLQANKINFDKDDMAYNIPEPKKNRAVRLFWCCLKLDSELRSELSPYVSVSGITFVKPPAQFPTIPQSIVEGHSDAAVKLASKYEDSYSWYYYLTEIAVRQIDNNLFDEIYTLKSTNTRLWDQPEFYEDFIWKTIIKYSNQYNGVINSLSPRIRQFVLHELDAEQVYTRLKKKFDKKANPDNHIDILDQLEDFLIDDDLLLRAQSECIIYIKTRILSSKLTLFRPLVYLLVHDRIPIMDLITAAMSAFQEVESQQRSSNESSTSMDSPGSSTTFSGNIHDSGFFPDQQAPLFYQEKHPEEDFADLIEETDDKSHITLKDVSSARIKIMKLFFLNLISLPKLSIPKLLAHRHPGSWYVLRNTFIGNIYQVLLYKKFKQFIEVIANDENLKASVGQFASPEVIGEMFEKVASKEIIQAMLQHSLYVFKYWKDEVTDCKVYIEYCERLIQSL